MDKTTQQQTMTGEVMAADATTARVKVGRTRVHPIYRKRYSVHSSVLAHVSPDMKVEKGDTVSVTRCRPVSKRKRWVVVKPS